MIRTVHIKVSNFVSLTKCDEVLICLPEGSENLTQSGENFIVGRVDGGLQLSSLPIPSWLNFIGSKKHYQFKVTYDDAQLIVDPATGAPFEIPCDESRLYDAKPFRLLGLIS